MTTIREIADKYFPDTRPANEPNRQAMCDTNAYSRKTCEAALRELGEELAKNLDVRAKDCRVIAAGSETHITRIMRHAAALEAELQALKIRAAIRESL